MYYDFMVSGILFNFLIRIFVVMLRKDFVRGWYCEIVIFLKFKFGRFLKERFVMFCFINYLNINVIFYV